MATNSNLKGGLSIPGSSRKKKAYSVSLHDNTFDISELPCAQDDVLSLEGDSQTPLVAGTCKTCGQSLPPKNVRDSNRDLTTSSSSNLNQTSHSLGDIGGAVPPRFVQQHVHSFLLFIIS